MWKQVQRHEAHGVRSVQRGKTLSSSRPHLSPELPFGTPDVCPSTSPCRHVLLLSLLTLLPLPFFPNFCKRNSWKEQERYNERTPVPKLDSHKRTFAHAEGSWWPGRLETSGRRLWVLVCTFHSLVPLNVSCQVSAVLHPALWSGMFYRTAIKSSSTQDPTFLVFMILPLVT